MATEELTRARQEARWWTQRHEVVWQLEHPSLELDPAIERLRPPAISRNPTLRRQAEESGLMPWDILGWTRHADGAFGRVRLVAVFLRNPTKDDPRVFCLDGPTDSEHRESQFELCLYMPEDPPERRWTLNGGLLRLFDLAIKHVAEEDIWRYRGKRHWPGEEAPHGRTSPARPNPALQLPPLRREAV